MSEKVTENITTTIFMDTVDLRRLHKPKFANEIITNIVSTNKVLLVNNPEIHNLFMKTLIGTTIRFEKRSVACTTPVITIPLSPNYLLEIKNESGEVQYKSTMDLSLHLGKDLQQKLTIFHGKRIKKDIITETANLNQYTIKAGIENNRVTLLNYSFPYAYEQNISGFDEYIIEDTSYIETRLRNKIVFKNGTCFEYKMNSWQATNRYQVNDFFQDGKQYLEFDEDIFDGFGNVKVINDDIEDFNISNLTVMLPRHFNNVVGFAINNLEIPENKIEISKNEQFCIELSNGEIHNFSISASTVKELFDELQLRGNMIINNNYLSLSSNTPFLIKPTNLSKFLCLKENTFHIEHLILRKNYIYMKNDHSRSMSSNGVSNIFARIENGKIVSGGSCDFNPPVKEVTQLKFNFVDAEGNKIIFSKDANVTFTLHVTEKMSKFA